MQVKSWSWFLAAMLLVSASTLAVSQMVAKTAATEAKNKEELYSKVELFSYALTTIQSEYVDEKSAKELIYGSLKGMLSSLDPHSQFMSPEDYQELKTETQGKFGGLGIEISLRDGLLTVISPIEDTPAWRAGLKAGDKIVKIGKDLTKDITLDDAVKKLRGDPGTQVTLTVLRESEGLVKDFTMTREIIHVVDIKDPHVMEGNIGYLRLTEFREDSFKAFHDALKSLKDQGADSLIIDLRNNPGGLLNVAIKITEDFLPSGKIIVSTRGRHQNEDVVIKSNNGKGDYVKWPIAVLINEGSASGSEILAGALKDNKRAVIVGAKSFGKGSVQSVIPLPDGSGLRLTTAKYFTPSGISIHGIGIMPDVVVEKISAVEDKTDKDGKDKLKDIDKVFDDLKAKDGEKVVDPKDVDQKKKDLADNQLQAAVNVIKGIKVYQGMSTEK